jgi:hypothetical protein
VVWQCSDVASAVPGSCTTLSNSTSFTTMETPHTVTVTSTWPRSRHCSICELNMSADMSAKAAGSSTTTREDSSTMLPCKYTATGTEVGTPAPLPAQAQQLRTRCTHLLQLGVVGDVKLAHGAVHAGVWREVAHGHARRRPQSARHAARHTAMQARDSDNAHGVRQRLGQVHT